MIARRCVELLHPDLAKGSDGEEVANPRWRRSSVHLGQHLPPIHAHLLHQLPTGDLTSGRTVVSDAGVIPLKPRLRYPSAESVRRSRREHIKGVA